VCFQSRSLDKSAAFAIKRETPLGTPYFVNSKFSQVSFGLGV
jgi:hypothetical protein